MASIGNFYFNNIYFSTKGILIINNNIRVLYSAIPNKYDHCALQKYIINNKNTGNK